MEKNKARDDISSATIEDLISTASGSKSGPAIVESLTELQGRVMLSPEIRSHLFVDKVSLSKLVAPFRDRQRKKLAESTRKRFMAADELLIQILSIWEHEFAESFPTLAAWIAFQRSKGVCIPKLSQEREEDSVKKELLFTKLQADVQTVRAQIEAAMTELASLMEIFTPSLDEAFNDCDADFTRAVISTGPISQLTEVVGSNNELFQAAREKFGYVTKKLVPRLSAIRAEAPETDKLADEAQGVIDKTQASSTYQSFLLLLAREPESAASNKTTSKDRKIDRQYDEWF